MRQQPDLLLLGLQGTKILFCKLKAHCVGNILFISAELSTAAHIQSWKKVREATSSGPSGIHFGHFIAGSTHANIAVFEACMSGIPWLTVLTCSMETRFECNDSKDSGEL